MQINTRFSLISLVSICILGGCPEPSDKAWPGGEAPSDKASESGSSVAQNLPKEANDKNAEPQGVGPVNEGGSTGPSQRQLEQKMAPGEVPVGGQPGQTGVNGKKGPPNPEGQSAGVVLPSVPVEVQKRLASGLKQIELGDREGALKIFSDIIVDHPDLFDAYDHRSMIDYNQQNYARVASDCTKAIDIARAGGFFSMSCPERCLTRRGASYLNLSRWKEAIVDFDEVLTYRPQDGFAYLDRGRAHFGLGQMDKAKADFERSLELSPDHEIVSDLSPYYLKKIKNPDFH